MDISISADDERLWVDTFMDGKTRLFDISDPTHPKQIYESRSASRSTWCRRAGTAERVYFTSSLLANWDKKGEDNEQYLKAYTWDGKNAHAGASRSTSSKEKLGRPHQMRFGAYALYGLRAAAEKPMMGRWRRSLANTLE